MILRRFRLPRPAVSLFTVTNPQDPVWGVTGTKQVPLEESEKVYKTTRVQVAPFTKTVDVFYYTYRDERVKPFTKTVPVFYYTYRDERVKPFTKTVVVPAYNYKTVKGACHPMYGCEYTRVRVGPYTMIKTVPAYNYEVRKTRVRPFTKTVAVHNYKVRKTRVRPFTKTVPLAESEKVYETRKVQVAPFTKTVNTYGWIPQPKLKVFQGYNTVTYTHPTDTTTRHDPTQHTCPNGQHMKPLPELRVYKNGGVDVFTTALTVTVPGFRALVGLAKLLSRKVEINTVAVEWTETDSHRGCFEPRFPLAEALLAVVDVAKVDWNGVGGSTANAVQSAVDAVNAEDPDIGKFVIDTNKSYLELHAKATAKATEITHKTLYVVLCIPEVELARNVAGAAGVTAVAIKAAKISKKLRIALAGGGTTGIAIYVSLAVAEYVLCNHTENPWKDKTTTPHHHNHNNHDHGGGAARACSGEP